MEGFKPLASVAEDHPKSPTVQEEEKPQESCCSKFRETFFPIENHELFKFFSLSLLMFFVIYVYTLVRDTKDTLVISHSGAEAVTFLKVYGVLPAATIFMIVYAKLSNVLSKKTLFFTTLAPFFLFFGTFAYILFPLVNQGFLHPHELCDSLESKLGQRWKYFIDCFRYWTFSLFYIMSELWGSIGVSVLFWQFANDNIKVDVAKRFYPLFGQTANLAPVCSGLSIIYLNFQPIDDTEQAKDDAFELSIQVLTVPILLSGVAITVLYLALSREFDREEANNLEIGFGLKKKKKKKPSMSMGQSFKFLFSQKYLGLICLIVLCYGLCINFTEVIWKSQVKRYRPNKYDYQNFMGMYSTCIGMTSLVVVFIGSNIIKRLGWLAGALTTPIMFLVLGLPFFAFIVFVDLEKSHSVLVLCVVVGTIQNILCKSVKYALFDPTKEMAYIPLDQESKVKGKAAIDVLGARIGKSGGALIQQGIVVAFGSIITGAPLVAGLFLATVSVWLVSVGKLNGRFKRLVDESTMQQDNKEPLLDSET